MNKKTSEQIKKYYKDGEVVSSYNRKRFSSVGGKFISETEVNLALSLLNSAFTKKKKVKILDLGAGLGRLSFPLKKKKMDVYCLDSSNEMARFLKKTINSRKIFRQTVFVSTKKSNFFDAITSLRFFDHFSIELQKKIIKVQSKSLRSGGYWIFLALNRLSLEYLFSKFLGYGEFNYYYSNSEYESMFKKLNLRVVAKKSVFIIPRGVFLKLRKYSSIIKILIYVEKTLSSIFHLNGGLGGYLLQKD